MVEEVIEGRQPFGPLPALFHPKKQALAQLPQLGQLLLQHLMDVGEGEGRRVEGTTCQPWSQPCILRYGLTPQLSSLSHPARHVLRGPSPPWWPQSPHPPARWTRHGVSQRCPHAAPRWTLPDTQAGTACPGEVHKSASMQQALGARLTEQDPPPLPSPRHRAWGMCASQLTNLCLKDECFQAVGRFFPFLLL